MSEEALNIISDALESIGINYEYMEWTSEPAYPYFTGEYQEFEPLNEDGLQETTFMLNGFSRGSHLQLEEAKQKIQRHFPSVGGRLVTASDGSAVAIFYANSLPISTGDAELKRIQINLTIKEWKGE